MHGPRCAALERSNQAARKPSAQPEGTPPRLAGRQAKTCLHAISWWPTCLKRRAGRHHFLQKSGRSREADMRLGFPAPAHIIHEQAVIASLNDIPPLDIRDRLEETEASSPQNGDYLRHAYCRGLVAHCCELDVVDPVCQQCAPVSNRLVSSRSHSA